MELDRKQRLYVWLTALFVAALLAGDLIGGKFFRVGGLDFSVGMIPFPLTFVLTDILNEFYGTRGARRVTYVGLGMAVFVFTVINVALALPASPKSPLDAQAFAAVFGWSSRLYVASLSAYVVGQILDIWAFQALRGATGGRFLWLRATGSTLISQLVDTMVVNLVLLWGTQPLPAIMGVARNGYVAKIVIAVGLTPLIYVSHGLVKRFFGASAALRDGT